MSDAEVAQRAREDRLAETRAAQAKERTRVSQERARIASEHTFQTQDSVEEKAAPAGMVSAGGHIQNGVILYNEGGSEFGTVTVESETHTFPDGTTDGDAVRVDGIWYRRSFIKDTKYVKINQ